MQSNRESAIALFKESLFEKAKLYRQVFGTDAGKKVLKELVDLYVKPEAFDTDPLKMARNVANQDLVKHLKEMTELTNE